MTADWPRYRRELHHLSLIWCLLCGIGATLGGIWALLHRENDGLYDG